MLSVLISVILIGLGIIHFNWVLGGTFGFNASLPTKENGERVLNPKKLDSTIVGIGLTAFGLFYLLKSELISYHLFDPMTTYIGWIIPGIFILRAIGEFKYVGFFKRVKTTPFGKRDTTFFSPMCLAIGSIGVIIQLTT